MDGWLKQFKTSASAAWPRARAWLQGFSPFAWVPILFVSTLSLAVGFCNYQHQIGGDRPVLVSASPKVIFGSPLTIEVYWTNVGKKPAKRGTAKLFAVDQNGKRGEPLGDSKITGAGTNVVPGYGGEADYRLNLQKLPGRLLVCARYFDDERSYEQAFMFSVPERSPNENIVRLSEEMAPDWRNCS
jgi:hypothetical protein